MELRSYRKEDYEAVCDFLIALNKSDRMHIHWNWARFEWMMGHPEFDRSLENAIGLWIEKGKVVGAAIYDMYFGEAFCGVLPEYEALHPEVLAYAYRELKDDAGLGIAICDENGKEIEAARAAGFSPAEQTETIMCLDLAKDLRADLPDGLTLREIDESEDAEALGWLFWQGFDHGEDRAEFEASEQGDARPRPHFNKQLSLAAATPDGELVSVSGLWFHDGTDYAYVEPVCTIPAWRGKGVARSLLFEALCRAKALGAKRAYVISDQVFYEKLGFEKELHFTFYWKK